MDMMGRIRHMSCGDKKSIRETARVTGLSRNTVSTWVNAPARAEPIYRRPAVPGKQAGYVQSLELALPADPRWPKNYRRTG